MNTIGVGLNKGLSGHRFESCNIHGIVIFLSPYERTEPISFS